MPLLKTADQIIGPALDKFYTRRPKAFKHINLREGVYWHPFAAHRAQAATELQRLSNLVASNTLEAEGQELRDYVASEYVEVPFVGASYAEGEITFARPEALVSGDIPKGTRFRRQANDTTQIPITEADYETLADVHFDVGQLTAGPVAVRAVSDGPASNHPIRTDSVPHGVIPSGSTLFDTGITVTTFSAAGGSEGADDPYVRQFARLSARGSHGPTASASRYGALRAPGVRHFLVYDVVTTGTQKILVADPSWGSSDRWARAVQQRLYDDDLVGFGCRVEVGVIRNQVVSVTATVVLRDWDYTADTLEIDEAIRLAARSYFDDRADWNVWKSRGLRSAISRAHPKILRCSDVVVRDVTGATVSEIASPDYTQEQLHLYLAHNAVSITYVGPS